MAFATAYMWQPGPPSGCNHMCMCARGLFRHGLHVRAWHRSACPTRLPSDQMRPCLLLVVPDRTGETARCCRPEAWVALHNLLR